MTGLLRWVLACCFVLTAYMQGFTQSNVVFAEYYIDTDPGFNKATPIAITPGTTVNNVPVTFNTSGLNVGAHFFGVRARNAAGAWSMDYYWIFFKPYQFVLSPAPLTTINRVEYYVDQDPGVGNATSVSITAGTNLSDISFNLSSGSTLAPGAHVVGVRARTVDGLWSNTNYWMFMKPYGNIATSAVSNVNAMEYFVDQDPGIGKATAVSITPGLNITNQLLNVPVTNIASGAHLLGARARNAAGAWSLTNYWMFVKPMANISSAAVPNVTAVEYFLDYDPGIGKGIPVSVSTGANIQDINFNADLTGIEPGSHFITARAKDSKGDWSHVNSWAFTIPGTPPQLNSIVSATEVCAGSTINVGYQFPSPVLLKTGNKYVAQLSDPSGNFSNPTEIGSLASTNNTTGSFTCTIPANMAQSGSYRIRVITTNQTVIGNNNGSNITVWSTPLTPGIQRPSADSTVCVGNPLRLEATPRPGYYYQWLLNGNPIGTTTYDEIYQKPLATASDAGNYSVRIFNPSKSNCATVSPVRIININSNVPAIPTVSPSGSVGVCLGSSRPLTSSTATSYRWQRNGADIPGATAATYNVSEGGTYTVITGNGTSCFANSSNNAIVSVGLSAATPVITSVGTTNICQGSSVQLLSSALQDNQWMLNGININGQTGATLQASVTGEYRVKVLGSGCEVVSDPIMVNVNPNVVPSVLLGVTGNNGPQGTNLVFTAIPTNGGINPQYQFRVNGITMQQGPSDTYSSNLLTSGVAVSVMLTSNANCVAPATATSSSITVNYLNAVTVSGRVYHPAGLIIPSVMMRVSGGDLPDSVTTDVFGRYNFSLMQQRNYVLSPYKNNDESRTNGIDVLDVVQLQSHILSRTLLTGPYRLMAGDVNNDNVLNILDIIGIRRLILGFDYSFSGNRMWSFLDSTHSFANVANPFPYPSTRNINTPNSARPNQSFAGFKLGDVNLDWVPEVGKNDTRETDALRLYFDTIIAKQGDVVRIAIKAHAYENLVGTQFTLKYAANDFELRGIENKQVPFDHNSTGAGKGIISFIWADQQGVARTLTEGQTLFELVLYKKRDVDITGIIIANDPTPSMAYNLQPVKRKVVIASGVVLGKALPVNLITSEQIRIYPNPTNGKIILSVDAIDAVQAKVVLLSSSGAPVWEQSVMLAKGTNELRLDVRKQKVLANGVYYLQVHGLKAPATAKLMLISQ